jgi:diaminohydroxyphosphoribosylaminopyrimidine deaminase/5-amino-6-(5-phosphoribosylamino)uracil reductase
LEWRDALREHAAEIVELPATPQDRVDLSALWEYLGQRGALTVLIEGGGAILGSAIASDLVQRVYAFIAPMIIGGSQAPGPVGDPGFATLSAAMRLRWLTQEQVGDDVLLIGAME